MYHPLNTKKVLIITYYWPPAGGPGVQRVLKFVKYLPQFGWEPVVLTVDGGEYPAIDHSLLQDIPDGLKVIKLESLEPFLFYKKITGQKSTTNISPYELVDEGGSILKRVSRFIRNNVFFPDARVGFYLRNKKKIANIVKEHDIDVVFTSSPPHSLQLLGLYIQEKTSVRWVADFRDPWSDAFWEKDGNRLTVLKERIAKLEREVLMKADEVVTVSDGIAQSMMSKISGKKVHTLYNGFDPDDITPRYKKSTKCQIVYVGGLGKTQISHDFFAGVASLSNEAKEIFNIRFIGNLHPDIANKVKETGLENVISIEGYKPHEEIVDIICQADLLLLFIPRGTEPGVLSGKFFEYLATGNQILTIGDDQNRDIEIILNSCNAGNFYCYGEALDGYLMSVLNRWLSGDRIAVDMDVVNRYSRVRSTEKLASILDEPV